MVYELPKRLPEELTFGGKTYVKFSGASTVARGFCVSNTDGWFYYVSRAAAESVGPIGHRRHFSVRTAKDRRCVHISMKNGKSDTKTSDIMIWYRYDAQFTGSRKEPVGLSRVISRGTFDHAREDKAIRLLNEFLAAMHSLATESKAPVKPVLIPVATVRAVYDQDAEEAAWEARDRPQAVVVHAPSSSSNWDDED